MMAGDVSPVAMFWIHALLGEVYRIGMLKLGVVEKSVKLVVGMQRMPSLLSEHS